MAIVKGYEKRTSHPPLGLGYVAAGWMFKGSGKTMVPPLALSYLAAGWKIKEPGKIIVDSMKAGAAGDVS